MASAFGHGIAALALGRAFFHGRLGLRFSFLSVMCAVLPDADVIGFAFGIEYTSLFGHRGFSHSLLFALMFGLVVVEGAFQGTRRFSRDWWRLWIYFFAVTASHGALDALTDGGEGVAFFSPFDTTRHFFPWRPLKVSPIGASGWFSGYFLRVLWSEVVWIGIPSALLVGAVNVWRRWRKQSNRSVKARAFDAPQGD